MKNLLTLILVIINTTVFAQITTFTIYSESKLVNLNDGIYTPVQGKIQLNLEKKYITIGDNYFHIDSIEHSKDKRGSYYNFLYIEVEIEKYVTIMFPKRKKEKIVIIMADIDGTGYIYYAEVL